MGGVGKALTGKGALGSDPSTKTSVRYPKAVQEALTRMSKGAEDIFNIDSDFYKDVIMPYQQSLMDINKDLLPLVSKNMKTQLQISHADMLGQSEIRDQLRTAAKGDIDKASQLGDQLFGEIQKKLDIEGTTQRKRVQLAQDFGRLEKNLIREGLDPTSPESRAIKKELEMSQARASIQARTQAEQEAFNALVGGTQTFQAKALQNVQGGMAGSMAGADPRSSQLQVSSDKGLPALGAAMGGQQILSGQTTTVSTQHGGPGWKGPAIQGSMKGAMAGGKAGGPWGAVAGGIAGGGAGALNARNQNAGGGEVF